MSITFTPDLETGMPNIDEQHKELFKRINDVVKCGAASAEKAETEKTLVFLGDYIVEHFTDEEILQRDSGYPKYDWHRGQHEGYIAEFRKLQREYEKNGPSLDFAMHLNKSVIEWIIRHIRSADKELGAYVNSKS